MNTGTKRDRLRPGLEAVERRRPTAAHPPAEALVPRPRDRGARGHAAGSRRFPYGVRLRMIPDRPPPPAPEVILPRGPRVAKGRILREAVLILGCLGLVTGAVAGTGGGPQVRRGAPAPIEDSAPECGLVQVDGLETRFLKRGECGPPIVLIHGFGGLINTWENNIARLAAGGYRVYALELKGFGLTAKPKDGKYQMADLARHLLGFLDVMGLEKPILAGHSMGAAVATRLALTHPDRVGGLVLVDPAPLEFPHGVDGLPVGGPAGRPPGDGARKLLLHLLTKPWLIQIYLKRSYHKTELVTVKKAELMHRTMRLDGAVEALIALLDSPPEPAGTLPPLASLKVPTLVIWGRHDRVVRADSVDAYVREITGARKIIFRNSGHHPHEEEPEKFNRWVIRFVNKVHDRPDRCAISARSKPCLIVPPRSRRTR